MLLFNAFLLTFGSVICCAGIYLLVLLADYIVKSIRQRKKLGFYASRKRRK